MAGVDPLNPDVPASSFNSAHNESAYNEMDKPLAADTELLEGKPVRAMDEPLSARVQVLNAPQASTHSFWDEDVGLKILTCIPIIGLFGALIIAAELDSYQWDFAGRSIHTLEKGADYMICLGIQAVSLIVIAAVIAPFASVGIFGLAFAGGFLLTTSILAYCEISNEIEKQTARRGSFLLLTPMGAGQAPGLV